MEYTPVLYQTIAEFTREKRVSFHMPVHGGGTLYENEIRQTLFQLDTTELDATDNLACPTGAIAQTQQNMARLFGADYAHILVGGSSAGLHAMLLSCMGRGDTVLVDRCVHQSVLNACALYGFIPVFFERDILSEFSIPGAVNIGSLQHAIDAHPQAKAILITSPTYYGICADIPALAQMAHAHGMALLADSAHGPHFAFCSELPDTAAQSGADLCVFSLHKTLGAVTQTALLLHCSGRIPPQRVKKCINMVQTTSPSYILMCSADLACAKMAKDGETLLSHAVACTQYAKTQLEKNSHLRCLPNKNGDLTRLVIHIAAYAVTGYKAAELLAHRFGIDVEMADLYNLVCIVGPLTTKAQIDLLVQALRKITADAGLAKQTALLPPMPPMDIVQNPNDAIAAKTKLLPLFESCGKICATTVSVYPPGVPCLVPGARVTQEIIQYLDTICAAGGKAAGLTDGQIIVLDPT